MLGQTIRSATLRNVAIAIGAVFALLTGVPGLTQQSAPLKVAYTAIGGGHTGLWAAYEAGLFQKRGIRVDLRYIAPSSLALQSLLAGEVDVIQGAAPSVVQAAAAGAELSIIASGFDKLSLSLMAAPSIEKVEDLKGKVVAVTRFGSVGDFGIRVLLNRKGLRPDQDVSLIQTGGLPESLSALAGGRAHAALLDPPATLRAKALGIKELMTPSEINIPLSMYSLLGTKKFISANRDTLRRFLAGYVEGVQRSKQDAPFALQVMGKYLKTEDQAILRGTYDFHVTGLMLAQPFTSPESVKSAIEFVGQKDARARRLKPEDVIDNSLLQDILK